MDMKKDILIQNRVEIMILSRDYEKGVNDLSIAISLNPTNTELYYWRATAYYNLKKY